MEKSGVDESAELYQGWRLFLDDERDPPSDGYKWVIARSYTEAVNILNTYQVCPDFISFDHDLGLDGDGHKFAKYFSRKIFEEHYPLSPNFGYYVHSQNPVGKENIESYMESFLKFWKEIKK